MDCFNLLRIKMKNYIFSTVLVVFGVLSTLAQVGIGTTSPNANAALEVASTSQGMLFPRMTSAQRDAIGNPAKGLTIYNTTLNSLQTNTGTSGTPIWKIWDGRNPATNGTADVSSYSCSTASTGNMSAGVAIEAGTVTQTITATVTRTGTYTISTTANGVTFAKSGAFSTTGAQNIILEATGTPTATGSNTFTLNTTPNCSYSRTTITVPGAPTSPVATAGNAQASVAFTAPASNGGSAIISYTVTSSPGGFTATGASSPIVVTGLINTAYTFTVVATNAAGNSAASSASVAVTPKTVPSAPNSLVATPGNAQATITFSAPTSNGGSAITGYTATSSPGGITSTATTLTRTVTGLTNGTAYTFSVVATNAQGNSAASTVTVTPRTVPGAPTSPVATAGNAQASVVFTAPASDGGSAITSYTVTSTPSSFTASGSSSPIVVTGLTNGTAYTFTVKATNAAGSSVASSASTAVTPKTVPGAPTSPVATAGNAQVTVTYTAPVSTGGSAITGYTATSSPGGITSTGTGLSRTVTGLTNGTAYTFTVVATNAAGNSVASTASTAVTPKTVPGAPTSPVATVGNAQASVAFTAPASDGGSDITSYTVTSSPGSITATGSSSPIVVTGLTNGTSYTFTVVATNAAGNSGPSSISDPVIYIVVPGSPTSPVATASNAQASVAFTAPTNNGGTPIISYTVTSNPGSFTATGASSPIVVTGLTNGTSYTFTVVATNAVGDSAPSAPSAAVTANHAIAGNAACVGKTISVTSCALVSGAYSNDDITTTDGTEYDWDAANTSGMARTSYTQALVEIGGQCWMRYNMNNTPSNFTTVPTWVNNSDVGWCGTYSGGTFPNEGRLYQWKAAMNNVTTERAQGICPTGWHIPSDCEFMYLENTLGMNVTYQQLSNGYGLTGDVDYDLSSLQTNGTNSSGFTLLAAGFRNGTTGAFQVRTTHGYIWTSTQINVSTARYRSMNSTRGVYRANEIKAYAWSVRCIKD
jgi:uncharacterized protein (TIGR02145 family)